ncbi:putative Zinc finger, BED-type [Corchorus olitorius]|uniref:Zinc finger, BED-type n=1 Tax=Corchorus olitorius TaxID=93759 RepID=A0A1R3JFS2_9ROSI|nr:putative Zinc finger, BED-type [Corchorus olitorius]
MSRSVLEPLSIGRVIGEVVDYFTPSVNNHYVRMTMASSNTPVIVEYGFNEYESSSKRPRTTSKVWNEMTKLETNDKDQLKAQCNHCKTVLSAKSSSGTSHLRRHLESCSKRHNHDIKQYTIATPSPLGSTTAIKTYKFDQEECRKAVSSFLVCGPYTVLTPMVKEMQEKFNKYWAEYSLILSCAAILDPRYNVNYVEYCYTKLYGCHASEFVQTVLNTLRLLFEEYVKNSNPNPSCLSGNSNLDVSLEVSNVSSEAGVRLNNDESDDHKLFLSKSKAQSEKSQLDFYLEERALDLNSDINILDYWSKSSIQYSELSLLARDLLAIPISTVAFESAFSMGKKMLNCLKSSLKPKTAQAVVCLDDWLRTRGFSAGVENEEFDSSDDDTDGGNSDVNVVAMAF